MSPERIDVKYLTIQAADHNIHVLPVSVVEDWIEGRQQITDADDWELLVRRICQEWLGHLTGVPPDHTAAIVTLRLGEPNAN